MPKRGFSSLMREATYTVYTYNKILPHATTSSSFSALKHFLSQDVTPSFRRRCFASATLIAARLLSVRRFSLMFSLIFTPVSSIFFSFHFSP